MRSPGAFLLLALCATSLSGLFGSAGSVSAEPEAEPPEKRIALVVGEAAYDKAPLETAANDAGLIAQSLQAAGFDVIGARDLDGDTLRNSFRDFLEKAKGSGANTVAVVYFCGYGVQLGGDNYLIPVEGEPNRDADIAVEGVRIGDYTRELAAIPLKASVIVLDAARRQPFIEGEAIASGLALMEPETNMLIAFNAAPGTVGLREQGPYGSYAQALAEMIRTGALSLPDMFDAVRLRVNEASKGAQVPWDAQKIATQFAFFARADDAPAPAAPADRIEAFRKSPIRSLSVQDAYAAALDRDTLQGYEDLVEAFPNEGATKRVIGLLAARREAMTWDLSFRADTPEAYWTYLHRYPRGTHAGDARRRLAALSAPLEPPASDEILDYDVEMVDYDVPPPSPEEAAYCERQVLDFGDFDFAPPPPPPEFLRSPPPDFVTLPPPLAPIGLFILPQPVFVPMPAYVRAPANIAAPPNNIIFPNLHNTTVITNVINVSPAQAAAADASLRTQVAAAAAAAPAGATAPVPPSVRQLAVLIHEGKAPLPRSASVPAAAAVPDTLPPHGKEPAAPSEPHLGANIPPSPARVESGPGASPSRVGTFSVRASAGPKATPSPADRIGGRRGPAARPTPPIPASPARSAAMPAARATPSPARATAAMAARPPRPAARTTPKPAPAARAAPAPAPVAHAASPPPPRQQASPAARAAPTPRPVPHAAPRAERPGPPADRPRGAVRRMQ